MSCGGLVNYTDESSLISFFENDEGVNIPEW